jgi:hypothetical protein
MTRTAIALFAALILAPASAAAADNPAGQASVIDATRWRYTAPASGYGVSTLRKAVSFAEARIVSSIGAVQRRRTNSTLLSPDGC